MYLIGNWKMTGDRAFANAHARDVMAMADKLGVSAHHTMVLCPPALWLSELSDVIAQSPLALGAQDCHDKEQGAYTGNISAPMLKEIGCEYAIVGHSERREYQHEDDALVARKVVAAYAHNVQPVLCVGESQAQREAGDYLAVVHAQIAAVLAQQTDTSKEMIIAYEPIWAIGTGLVASPADIEEVCAAIHAQLAQAGYTKISVLYGGSVKAGNAAEIFALTSVNGVLVGGASVDLEQWTGISQAATSITDK